MGAKGEPVEVAYPADGAIINPRSPIAIFLKRPKSRSRQGSDGLVAVEGESQEMVVKGWMHSVRDDVARPKAY